MEVKSKDTHTFKHILPSSLDASVVAHPCQYLLKAQTMHLMSFGPFLATATLHLTPCHIHCRLECIFTILHQLVLIKHKRKKHLLLAQTSHLGLFFQHHHHPPCHVSHILEPIYAKKICQYKIKKEKKLTMPNNTSAVIQACVSGL